MNKINKAIKSRTVWTIVALFLINGFNAISAELSPEVLAVVNPILGLLAIYFKVSPSQKY